jgi:hypothetical protein
MLPSQAGSQSGEHARVPRLTLWDNGHTLGLQTPSSLAGSTSSSHRKRSEIFHPLHPAHRGFRPPLVCLQGDSRSGCCSPVQMDASIADAQLPVTWRHFRSREYCHHKYFLVSASLSRNRRRRLGISRESIGVWWELIWADLWWSRVCWLWTWFYSLPVLFFK